MTYHEVYQILDNKIPEGGEAFGCVIRGRILVELQAIGDDGRHNSFRHNRRRGRWEGRRNGREYGPAGGDVGRVGGLELAHEVAVVALCNFDGAVAEEDLRVVDAVFHGDLAAGVGPQGVIGFARFPTELAEPVGDAAEDVVGAMGSGAGDDVIGHGRGGLGGLCGLDGRAPVVLRDVLLQGAVKRI